ncbi:transporter [Halalkalibacter urbisdiaboli]|uniref:transporter n=1 Tax=Halalkalibacter urbisdiaboli TaxID=1960589 RepID=UPI000B43A2DF|nr:transporter [Halalkalibacter urbisdiaboli]
MRFFKYFYEGIMLVFVAITIITLWTEHAYNSFVNFGVWLIFFFDFVIRFYKSKEKWRFLKRNPFLIIAVIPVDQFFQVARIVRIIYLFRIKTIAKYYLHDAVEKLTYRARFMIIAIIIIFLCLQSWVILLLETQVMTFLQSFLLLGRHILFFGHRAIEVTEGVTLLFFAMTTVLGVLLHGITLQWLFSKIEKIYTSLMKKDDVQLDK